MKYNRALFHIKELTARGNFCQVTVREDDKKLSCVHGVVALKAQRQQIIPSVRTVVALKLDVMWVQVIPMFAVPTLPTITVERGLLF